MKIDIVYTPKIKPLIANISRIDIGQYLVTKEYKLVLLENNFDLLWKSSDKFLNLGFDIELLGVDKVTAAVETLNHLLNKLFCEAPIYFFKLVKITFLGFIWYDKSKTDMSKIILCLEKLNMSEEDLLVIKAINGVSHY